MTCAKYNKIVYEWSRMTGSKYGVIFVKFLNDIYQKLVNDDGFYSILFWFIEDILLYFSFIIFAFQRIYENYPIIFYHEDLFHVHQ